MYKYKRITALQQMLMKYGIPVKQVATATQYISHI